MQLNCHLLWISSGSITRTLWGEREGDSQGLRKQVLLCNDNNMLFSYLTPKGNTHKLQYMYVRINAQLHANIHTPYILYTCTHVHLLAHTRTRTQVGMFKYVCTCTRAHKQTHATRT